MSGNVWEWVSTIYHSEDYPYPYVDYDGREDSQDLTGARGIRGGSFRVDNTYDLRATYRNWEVPTNGDDGSIGFRCAQTEGVTVSNEPIVAINKIVFVSDRDGNEEIYTMNSDGTDVQRLTNSPTKDYAPRWSPDGTQIVFVSTRDGDEEIFIMQADGSNQIRLTDNEISDNQPRWSPDGARIVYVTGQSWDEMYLYAMNPDGSQVVQLTDAMWLIRTPRWSPTGEWIAFSAARQYEEGERGNYSYSENHDIYRVRPNSFDLRRLTISPAWDVLPSWSPDGTQIAFISDRFNEVNNLPNVYRMQVDGSDVTPIDTDWNNIHYGVTWSPNPNRIIYSMDDRLIRIKLDPYGGAFMTSTADSVRQFDWSPDGAWLIYADEGDIYGFNSTRQNLTNTPDAREFDAQWSPIVQEN